MLKVYVAGPYSTGNQARNTKAAIRMGDNLADHGYAPLIPHLTHFWDMIYPREYEWWLKYDFEWLKCCGALIRMPGESSGADREVEFALDNGIPVYVMENEYDFGANMHAFLRSCNQSEMARQ